ncbi:conserved phage C-terminal domain-containing protein [Bacillus sonorensis]|uniref:conserved phage C-terminal domain-containing protein n=1 Tax=Bacillus sonorensis TaxID=119858 RepID=UPI002DBDA5E0|nr:conserved phage C-terminal domain-containing protein [Bacillus sonorensis]MEC1428930.1 conserved phage C-terminal domain-containing protein [Bacillus sonorensis]
MAKYRHVHTEFWQDSKVLEEMTPEDRYFYLYLLTNPKTSQIGIYSITKKQMAFDLGYSIESINSLMERFLKHHKLVEYNPTTREIAIIKWGRYNLTKAGKPMLDCIQKELWQIKDKSLIHLIYPHIPNESIKQLFLRYVNDTSTIRGQKEKEKEKEKYILSSKLDDASSSKNEKDEIPYKLIIDLLNKVAGTRYRYTTEKTKKDIKARWNEGFRFEDFKHVILVKTEEWLNDPAMNKFLRPQTLFGTKFESYLNQKGGATHGGFHKGASGRSQGRNISEDDIPY